jgi:uncharacterized protein (TIGR02145 family)
MDYPSWSDTAITLQVPLGVSGDGVVFATIDGRSSNVVPFVLQTLFTVSGTIASSGLDVSGITVSDGTRSAMTDAGGTYRMNDVPNGSYTVVPARFDLSFTPASKAIVVAGADVEKVDFISTSKVTDIDGNEYNTVKIGSQVWMVENLRTTRLRDGTAIPLVTVDAAWAALATPGCCWYGNDAGNGVPYGALYNWYAVNTGRLAPAGWHVPSDEEWKTLEKYLGMTQSDADATGYRGANVNVGGKMKEAGTTHWNSPNTGADNSSGFTALPGSYRNSDDGIFYKAGGTGIWWSSSEHSAMDAWKRGLNNSNADVNRNPNSKVFGFSVRCVRD